MTTRLTRAETARWEQSGRDAFAAGSMAIPGADPAVNAAIEHLPIGGGAAPIMRAWMRGWMAANLAAPLDDACLSR